jgi:hypothetical protein
MAPAVQKSVLLVLWANAHNFGMGIQLTPDILDIICEYVGAAGQ